MNDFKRAEFTVHGLVQGVGFRFFVLKHARVLGLKGYAMNLMNGDVRVVAEGNGEALSGLHNILKQGPSRSYVESVRVVNSDYQNEFSEFFIK